MLAHRSCLRQGPVRGATQGSGLAALHQTVRLALVLGPALDGPEIRDADLDIRSYGEVLPVNRLLEDVGRSYGVSVAGETAPLASVVPPPGAVDA